MRLHKAHIGETNLCTCEQPPGVCSDLKQGCARRQQPPNDAVVEQVRQAGRAHVAVQHRRARSRARSGHCHEIKRLGRRPQPGKEHN